MSKQNGSPDNREFISFIVRENNKSMDRGERRAQ
jgi:hypothetical protein